MVKRTVILLSLFSLLAFGCSKEDLADFKGLFPLRKAIIEQCDVKDVNVTLQNGHCIGVSFINSKYNDESQEAQNEVRKKTLEIISRHYSDKDKIDRAWIAFVIHKRRYLVINYTNSLNTKFYKKAPDGSWKEG